VSETVVACYWCKSLKHVQLKDHRLVQR